jgi:hypothetical protein
MHTSKKYTILDFHVTPIVKWSEGLAELELVEPFSLVSRLIFTASL